MPRIRTIKPEFWSDEKLATVSEASLLVAIGLLNLADDEGYFNANPKLIDAFIFPLRESSMSTHGAITELSNIGYIEVFKCLKNEKDIGLVKNFLTHQVISRPTASKLAPIVDLSSSSVNTHGVITDNSPTERKGKEQGREVEKEGKGAGITPSKLDYSVLQMTKEQCADVIRIRKKNKGPTFTQLIINQLAKQFLLAEQKGFTFQDSLIEWEVRGWKSFKADWMKVSQDSKPAIGKTQEIFNQLSEINYDRR
jgi:hypothetical protein